jgi:hypothetical protein
VKWPPSFSAPTAISSDSEALVVRSGRKCRIGETIHSDRPHPIQDLIFGDQKNLGDYRTERVILEIYHALAESIRTGQPYQTRIDPPP